jgi:hypothetical protein
MILAVQVAVLLIALPLELLIIAALLRGSYRRFPFLFAYAVTDLLTTVLEIPPAIDRLLGIQRTINSLPSIYWQVELLMQPMVYAVVISLIYLGTQHLKSRRAVRTALVIGALLVAGISFFVHYSPALTQGEWVTPWTRDLDFAAAVLDLGLWALLIGRRERDQTLLLLSGGLGIQFTGDAISSSIRQLAIAIRSHGLSQFGGILAAVVFLPFLYIWWQALRRAPAYNRPAGADRLVRTENGALPLPGRLSGADRGREQ